MAEDRWIKFDGSGAVWGRRVLLSFSVAVCLGSLVYSAHQLLNSHDEIDLKTPEPASFSAPDRSSLVLSAPSWEELKTALEQRNIFAESFKREDVPSAPGVNPRFRFVGVLRGLVKSVALEDQQGQGVLILTEGETKNGVSILSISQEAVEVSVAGQRERIVIPRREI